MRIFVAGANGAMGRRVVPALLEASYQVTATGQSREKREALVRAGARTVDLDPFDGAAVRQAVTGHNVIINLAGYQYPFHSRTLT